MLERYKKIALIAPANINNIKNTLIELVRFLQTQQLDISCEAHTATLLSHFNLPMVANTELGKNCDLLIVVGGDGSILRAAKNALRYNIPVIGINRGKLGFLTDICPLEIKTRLTPILNGQFWVDNRFLLEVQIDDVPNELALNDVVIASGHTPHMLEFEIYIDENFVCSHHADGLIIASPTGSTAYSLSAGGPILYPTMDAFVILPMFSHNLTSRPIIVPGNSHIHIEFSAHNVTAAKISCDGAEIATVAAGKFINLQKHSHSMRLIHPVDYNFYESLRSKLYWGQKLV